MLFPRLVSIAILLALPASAFASTATELASIDKRLKTCLDTNRDNTGLKGCTSDAYAEADEVLNRVYKTFVSRLKQRKDVEDQAYDQEILKRLVASERAWIAYRDAECSLQGTRMLNGSGEGLEIGQCLYDLTNERAKSLDRLADGK